MAKESYKGDPWFLLIFFFVFLITILAAGVSIWIVNEDTPTANQQTLFENMQITWHVGVGGILGMFVGRY